MPLSELPALEFDDVSIDFVGRRLLRAGIEQPLEPKAFDVLALLAGVPGRVFARDEILDAVWGHRHVTPGVLNRVMTLLRHALGETAHAPRWLHTVHGVGYRLDVPPTSTAPAHETGIPADIHGLAADPEQPVSPQPLGRRAGDISRSRWWRWWPAGVLFLGGALLALFASVFLLRTGTAPTSPAADTRQAAPTLVVMPLKPIGDSPATGIVAEGLSEELIDKLAQIGGLRVIARASTRLASKESDDLPRLVKRLGITHALEGSLQQTGQRLRVRLRLVEASDGRTLWAQDFDRDAADVLALQRDIARRVATSLALRMGLAASPTAKAGDARFLRRYLVARSLTARLDLPAENSTELAEAEFRALLQIRPDDARVHEGLARALDIRAKRTPPLAPALRAESLREAAIAMRLDPTLPWPYSLVGFAACDSNAWERCLDLIAKARAAAPSNADLLYGYARELAALGYLERAETVARDMVRRDPLNPIAHFLLGRILDTQGRHEEARGELDLSDNRAAYGRWYNAVWRKDFVAALRIAETQIGAPDFPGTYGSRLAPGYIAASRALIDPTLWPEALVAFDRFERGTGLWNFSRILAPDAPAHAAELIARLNEVRERRYASWHFLLWTRDLAWLRRDPAFQANLRDTGILAYWQKHGYPSQCRPRHDGGADCD